MTIDTFNPCIKGVQARSQSEGSGTCCKFVSAEPPMCESIF